MMTDLSWLSSQAKQVHMIFNSIFYALITVFLVLGIFLEYFKWPLGQTPAFSVLIGRAIVAVLLLSSYTEVSNTMAGFADALSTRLGDLNKFHLVLSSMGDKLGTLSWSWVSVRDTITLALSFVSFFLLYFSVYVVEAFFLYVWTLLYVFSPLLIALFVLPATAGATKALYRSLFEVSCWKIVWSVLATLLWSTALSKINQPTHDISFITSICFNLILAGSVLMTPMVVHSLAGAGLAGMAQTVGAVAVGATTVSPKKLFSSFAQGVRNAHPTVKGWHEKASEYFESRANAARINRMRASASSSQYQGPSPRPQNSGPSRYQSTYRANKPQSDQGTQMDLFQSNAKAPDSVGPTAKVTQSPHLTAAAEEGESV